MTTPKLLHLTDSGDVEVDDGPQHFETTPRGALAHKSHALQVAWQTIEEQARQLDEQDAALHPLSKRIAAMGKGRQE